MLPSSANRPLQTRSSSTAPSTHFSHFITATAYSLDTTVRIGAAQYKDKLNTINLENKLSGDFWQLGNIKNKSELLLKMD